MKTIELIVSPTGEVRLQTKGFQGKSCQEASRFLEEALGTKTTETLSAEYYQQAPASQQLQQGAGS